MRIRRAALAAIRAHATRDLPNECCGLLIGRDLRIEDAVPARNLLASPTRFRIAPADHFRAIRLARAAGHAVIGAYHSHPAGPAQPSETDRADLADSAMIQIIVVPAGPEGMVRAFRWRDGGFVEEPLDLDG